MHMTLKENILNEILAGRLPKHWTSSDLLANPELAKAHPKTTVRSYPANHSASLPGLGLGTGHQATNPPLFYRVGRRGRALEFAFPIHCAANPPDDVASADTATEVRQTEKSNQLIHDQNSNGWSVSNPTVQSFIKWVADKERSEDFRFFYDIKNANGHHHLDAHSIQHAALQYRWPAKAIPDELVGHIDGFPQEAEDLGSTVALLSLIKKELRDSLQPGDAQRHLKACWATLYWGGVAKDSNPLFYGLRFLRDCSGSPDGLLNYHSEAHKPGGWFDPGKTDESRLLQNIRGMSAGITKIHSLLADELVIYDSRVACALAWLVERYCEASGLARVPDELLLCLPAEQPSEQFERNPVGVRKKQFLVHPTKYKKAGSYKRLWSRDMLRASLILSAVLDQLGKRDPQTFLEYQLGLFMIGYHLGSHTLRVNGRN